MSTRNRAVRALLSLLIIQVQATCAFAADDLSSEGKSTNQVKAQSRTGLSKNHNLETVKPGRPGAKKLTLEQAVQLIDTNPRAAERALKQLNEPQAKGYLAYLYLDKKAMFPGQSRKVDTLMYEACAASTDAFGLGDVDPKKRYHYTNMSMFLVNLRYLQDANDFTASVPVSMAREHPAAFFDAFDARWGSSRDGHFDFNLPAQDDVANLPQFKSYLNSLYDIFGEMDGTIRFMHYRRQRMAVLKASFAPQLFAKPMPDAATIVEVDAFLNRWSNQELYNKQTYNQWHRDQMEARKALRVFYKDHLKLSDAKASLYATQAVDYISVLFVDNYSHSEFREWRPSAAYRLLSQKNVSLENVRNVFEGRTLEPAELAEALRLAILNNHSLEIIQWLVKKGAPLSGGSEPPLFTAVLRPDVLDFLIKAGADVNEQNPLSKTALIQAAQYNALKSCELLKAAGADVNHAMIPANGEVYNEVRFSGDYQYYRGGRTALVYATMFAGYPVIKYLVDSGAKKYTQAQNQDNNDQALSFHLGENHLLSRRERTDLEKLLSQK